jgi:hypothetical protein
LQDRSTDFEFLPIDVSLERCMRYFQTPPEIFVYAQVVNRYVSMEQPLAVYMRATPTLTSTLAVDGSATQDDQNNFVTGNNKIGLYTKFNNIGGPAGGNKASSIKLNAEL